jgi:glycosyltransferase involved in cell wall biosynthesis
MTSGLKPPVTVSVLIPVYNGAPYLAEAIDSVLAQTLQDFELIIADDGSSDGSQGIAQRYASADPRIVFCQNPRNLGSVKNINGLLLAAKGKYIKFLIQDDVLAPHCLKRFAEILDTLPDVSLVTSYQRFIGELGDVRKLPTLPAIGRLPGRLVQRHVLAFGNWIGGETAVMFRRETVCLGLFNPDWVWQVDQDLWLRFLAEGDLYVVPEILTFPRIHGQQGTVTLNTGFTFLEEELLQLKVAFAFPRVYGTYSKAEQKALYERHLVRLIDKGLAGADEESRKSMIRIGTEVAPWQFRTLLAAAWVRRRWSQVLEWRVLQAIQELSGLLAATARDLPWKRRYGFRPELQDFDLGFGRIGTFGIIRVPVDLLRSPILTEGGWNVTRLENTPHYGWIKDLAEERDDTDSRRAYRAYLEKFHPDEDIEYTLTKIVKLVSSIRAETADSERVLTIATHPPARYRNEFCAVIYDGNHRACIAKALGHSGIHCRLVNIRMTSTYFPPKFFDYQIAA